MSLKAGIPVTIIIFFLFSFPLFSQSQNEEDSLGALEELVNFVTDIQTEGDTVTKEIPQSLVDIVEEIYSETVVPYRVTTDVLSFLTEIYSDHGYHESGDWSPDIAVAAYQSILDKMPELNSRDFLRPVDGRLTSGYGFRKRFNRLHRGVDIALNYGDTVRCSLPGIVIKNGYDLGGYGIYVIVSHLGNIETLYGHLSKSLVNVGQVMESGQVLGLGGSTGNSLGPHLHFETRKRGKAIDPFSLFDLRVPAR